MNDKLLTIQDAAKTLGVSPSTLRRWEAKNILVPLRTGGNQRRYAASQLEDFKKNQYNVETFVASEEMPVETTPELQSASLPQERIQPVPTPTFLTVLNENTINKISEPEMLPVQNTVSIVDRFVERRTVIFSTLGIIIALFIVIGSFFLTASMSPQMQSLLGARTKSKPQEKVNNPIAQVLGAKDITPQYVLKVNVPSIFGKPVTFLDNALVQKQLEVDKLATLKGGITTKGANIDAGKGKVTASNLLYSVLAGTNISISGDPQRPTISANVAIPQSVSSLQGQTGAVQLASGDGIDVNGLTINNTGVLSVQGETGTVEFTGGDGITVDGFTITNSDPGSAQKIFGNVTVGSTTLSAGSNSDTLTFAAGSGVTLTPDAGTNTITIDAAGGGSSQWTTTGADIYYTLGNVGIGTNTPGQTLDVAGSTRISGGVTLSSLSTGVVHSDGTGLLSSSAVDLTSEVTGMLGVGNGGTGNGAVPTNGQILIGNGSGYTIGTITQGSGIGISNGGGSITVTNNGVVSLAGTVNQVSVSGATGAVTLSLPQNINSGAAPTFASLNLTSNTNQLTLGSGTTGVLTLATLTSGRTYTLPDASGEICISSGNCSGLGGALSGSGSPGYIPKFNSPTGLGDSSIYDNGKVGIGTNSPEGLFSVSGGPVGAALVTLNQTGSNDILTGSASGVTKFVFDQNGNLNLVGGGYLINGNAVLSATTLGAGVVNSSLTSVGALTSGSIANGFGTIDSNNTITGTTVNGTTGINTGGGAGTVRLDASGNLVNIGTISSTYLSTGSNVVNLASGTSLQFNGTTVIDNSRNLVGINGVAQNLIPTAANTYSLGTAVGNQYLNVYGQTIYQNGNQVCDTGGNCSGLSVNYWDQNNGVISPKNTTVDLLVGGTGSASAKFGFINVNSGTPTATISAGLSGALYITADGRLQTTNDQTLLIGGSTTGNITLSPLNGNGTTLNTGTFNLASGKTYQINGVDVLSGSTLGPGVVNSSLTSVGALNSGSIASGFGTILTTNTIQGSDFTASGTTGFTGSGNGAGLTFSGSGNHIVSASSGTLEFGAATLTGAITGNGQDITGLNNLAAAGAVTFGAFSSNGGVLYTNGSGVVSQVTAGTATQVLHGGASPSFGLVALGTDVSGNLPVGNGGTGITNYTTGDLLYASASNTLAARAIGSAGQILTVAGGVPVWQDAGGTINFWQRANGAVAPLNLTDDFLVGGNATASAKFQVFGTTGNASSSGNLTFSSAASIQTTKNQTLTLGGSSTGNIVLSPVGGAGFVTINGTENLSGSNVYQIGGTTVLSSTTLGTGVTGSSLTSVGALAGGSIASGFGTIATSNTITGTTLNGTTGINTGAGAGTQRIDVNGHLVNITGVSSSLTPTAANTYSLGTAAGNQYATIYGQSIFQNGNQVCDTGGNCAGLAVNYWDQSNGVISPKNTTVDFLIGSNATASAKFGILNVSSGTPTASLSAGLVGALFITGDGSIQTTANRTITVGGVNSGDITLVPSNGAGTTNNNGTFNILGGRTYQVDGVDVLSATTLGTSVLNSSLTTVGALTTGSIASGFGTILTTNTIQGSDITASGATGFTATGNGAGLTFSGSGNHIISASSGTLELAATTLTGAITGNSQNITGINNLGATGTVTFGGLSTGVVQSNGSGVLSSSALNIAGGASYISGILPSLNGGTGADLSGATQGSIAYFGSTGVMSALGPSTAGFLLKTNGVGQNPSWVDAASLTTSYWQRNLGALAPLNITDDLLIGGTSTTSAHFAFINNSGPGIPTASLSANLNGVYLTASGTLSTTNQSTLNLGGSATGNIFLNPAGGSGYVSINGLANCDTIDTDAAGRLTCGVDAGGSGSAGTINVQNNGVAVGAGIDTINFSTDFLVTNSPATRDTVVIADDVIDFSELSDTMVLDNSTSVSLGNNNYTLGDTSGNGNLVVAPNAGGKAALVVNKQGNGDIFTASKSGTTKFTVLSNGDVQVSNLTTDGGVLYTNATGTITQTAAGGAGQVLTSNGGGAPSWVSTSSINFWQRANGSIAPLNISDDFLLGSVSTGSAKFAFRNVAGGTPTASISANAGNNATFLTGTGNLATTNRQTLALGSASTGDISFTPGGTQALYLASNGTVSLGAAAYANCAALTTSNNVVGCAASANYLRLTQGAFSLVNDTADFLFGNIASTSAKFKLSALGTAPVASVSGSTSYAASVVDQTGRGDLFTASKSGATKFTVLNNGNIQINNLTTDGGLLYTGATGVVGQTAAGTAGQVLTSNAGGAPTWVSSSSVGVMQRIAGAVAPVNVTDDLLLGGLSTASAKFAFINNTGAGTPTASISANSGNNAAFLSGTGVLGTTNRQTLTLGGSGTGDIAFAPGGTQQLYLAAGGQITLNSQYTSCGMLTTSASNVLTCGSVPPGVNYLRLSQGAFSLVNDTADFLFGSIASNSAKFKLSSNGTSPVSSVSANTSYAAEVVDQSGSGDLFTASKSGATKFVVKNNGFVGIGTNSPYVDLQVAGGGNVAIDSQSTGNANATLVLVGYNSGVGTAAQIWADNGGSLELKPSSSGRRIDLRDDLGNAMVTLIGSTVGFNTTSPNALLDLRGVGGVQNISATAPVASIAGSTTFATTIIDQAGSGDLFTASKSGASKFTVLNNGNIAIANYSNCGMLTTTGTTLTCSSVPAGAQNFWQLNSGALSPFTASPDLLLGSTSTASAKFGFLNVAGGTPTASISANASNNAISIAGNGVIGTTNAQSLTLGNASTGNLVLAPGGDVLVSSASNFGVGVSGHPLASFYVLGSSILKSSSNSTTTFQIKRSNDTTFFDADSTNQRIGIGNSSPLATLDVDGTSTVFPVASIAGSTTFATTVIDQSGAGDLFTASKSGASKFTILNNGNIQINNLTSDGGLLYTNASGVVAQTTTGSSGQVLTSNGGGAPTWVATSSLNFWQRANGIVAPLNITDDLLLGGTSTASAKFAFINTIGAGTPTASISANSGNNAAFFTGTGVLGTTNRQTLTLGGSGTGDISLAPRGTSALYLAGDGTITLNAQYTSCGMLTTSATNVLTCGSVPPGTNYLRLSQGAFSLVNDTADFLFGNIASSAAKFKLSANGTSPVASVSGSTSYSALVVDNTGVGDLFTASKSGATKFTVLNNGNIAIANYSNCGMLTTTGTTLTCSSVPAGAQNFWQLNSGALSPFTASPDLLLGSTSTASAKFGFLNVAGGTPTASISASSGNNALSIDGLGNIKTLNKQTLTVGGTTTGNIVMNPNANVLIQPIQSTTNAFQVLSAAGSNALMVDATNQRVGIGNGIVAPTATLDVAGSIALTGSVSAQSRFVNNSTQASSITTAQYGIQNQPLFWPTGATLSQIFGFINVPTVIGSALNINEVFGGYSRIDTQAGYIGTINQAYGQYIKNPSIAGGNITTNYGLYIDTMTAGSNNYALYSAGGKGYFAGNLGIGSGNTTPAGTFDIDSNSGTIPVATISGATSQASVVIDQSGVGDLFTASKSGATKFTILNNGNISMANYNNCGMLTTTGTVLTCSSAPSASGDFLRLSNGAFSLVNDTTDFLFGNIASSAAKFKLSASGTAPVASVSAKSSYAALVVDNSGVGDLFTASKSGATKFTIKNSGNVLVGATSPTVSSQFAINLTDPNLVGQIIQAAPGQGSGLLIVQDSSGGALANIDANGYIHSYSGLASTSNNVFALNISDSGITTLLNADSINKHVSIGTDYLTAIATLDVRNMVSSQATASISGSTSSTGLFVDNSGTGDLFNVAKSGNNKFTVQNTGNILLGNYSNCGMLTTTGTTLTCSSAPAGSTNYLRLSSGAFSLVNDTADFLFGNIASSAAKFKLSASGTAPVASVSGSTSYSALVVDNTGVGDLFTASKSGATKFVINNSGNVAIGKSLPTATLDIVGQAGAGATNAIMAIAALGGTGSNAGGNAGSGGGFTFSGGAGGSAGTASTNGGGGGVFSVLTGSGGSGGVTSGTPGNGGNLSLSTGNGSGVGAVGGNGGNIDISAGSGGNNVAGDGVGGNISMTAGAGGRTGTGGNGGNIYIAGGNGGTGPDGNVLLGVLSSSTLQGNVGIGTTSVLAKLDVRGNITTMPVASFSASSFQSVVVVDQRGTGDLFTASKSGATKFTILNNGNISMANYSNCGMLTTVGTVMTCSSAPSASGDYLRLSNGAFSLVNDTTDFLFGSIASTSAKFKLSALGTAPVASVSAKTSYAALVVDNTGSGDLFTASKSGATKFVITNAGNVGIGTNAPTAQFEIANSSNATNALKISGTTPTNTMGMYIDGSGNAHIDSTGVLQLNYANGSNVTIGNFSGIGGADTTTNLWGDVRMFRNTNSVTSLQMQDNLGNVLLNGDTTNLRLGVGLNVTAPVGTLDVRGSSATTSVATVSGSTNFAAVVVSNSGAGDLFTASKSGATKFTILNNGNIQANNYNGTNAVLYGTQNTGLIASATTGSSNLCLLSGASAPTWGACDTSPGVNLWQTLSGAISLKNNTTDLLIGGTATASADFAFLNVNSGTPTASISANSGNNATTIAGNGVIGTTNRGTLTLGSSTTGDIDLVTAGTRALYLAGNGTITLNSQYTSCGSLTTSASNVLQCSGASSGGGDYLRLSQGAFSLVNDTTDFLFGSSASTSAKFKLSASGTAPVASVSGKTSYAALVVDQAGVGDLFTASKSGATKFVIKNNGYIGVNTKTPTALVDIQGIDFSLNTTANAPMALNVVGGIGGGAAGPGGFSAGGINLAGGIGGSYVNDAGNGGIVSITGGSGGSSGNTDGGLGGDVRILAGNGGGAGAGTDGSGGNITLLAGTGGQSLSGGSGGNIYIAGGAAGSSPVGNVFLGLLQSGLAQGNVGIGTATVSAKLDVRGSSGTLPIASISGKTAFAGLVVDNNGVGDLFTASKSGASKFTVLNNGNIAIANYSNCGMLTTVGTVMTCSSATGGGQNYWQLNSGALSPFTTSPDLLLGGTATVSAKFGFLNVAGGTPTASISANSGANSLYLLGNGVIGTTNRQTLAIGDLSTGDIVLGPRGLTSLYLSGGGTIKFSSTYASCGMLSTNATNTLLCGTAPVSGANYLRLSSGAFSLVNDTADFLFGNIASSGAKFKLSPLGTAPVASVAGTTSFAASVVDQAGVGDIFAASKSGATKFVIKNNGTIGIGTANPDLATSLNINSGTSLNKILLGNGTTKGLSLTDQGAAIDIQSIGQALFINNSGGGGQQNTYINAQGGGLVGVGTTGNGATLDVAANSGTLPVFQVTGSTAKASALIDQSGAGDIFTASKSGSTKFTIKNSGTVLIGDTTNGIQFDPTFSASSGYQGSARPTKTIVLSPEYAGAVLTASGSATTTGTMTSDASPSAAVSNFQTYYEWNSTSTSLQDYTVAVRFTLPKDFSAWATSNAITVNYGTNLNGTGSNKLDLKIYNADNTLTAAQSATPNAIRTGLASGTNKTWTSVNIDDSELTAGVQALNAAGDIGVIYIKMYSKDSNYVQVGDITLNYLSRF